MIRVDENALVCDLAETYGIFEWRSLPVHLVATLSFGLRENSRIKSKLYGHHINQDTILLAGLLDRVTQLIYGLSGKKSPDSVVEALMGVVENTGTGIKAFKSAEDFEKEKKRIIGGI